MADNIVLPGTGQVVAAEEDGGIYYQLIKLVSSENYIGSVGGNSVIASATPNLTVAGAYGIGDYVGTSTTPMEFALSARTSGGTFFIPGATLIDYALQSISGELWVFNATVTAPTDNAAWTLSSANMAKLICVIPFSTYYANAAYSVSQGHPDFVGPFKATVTSLFGCFVTRGTPTYATGNLTFNLSIAQD
jgi:hypothetical protein